MAGIKIELSGGLEVLFGKKKEHVVALSAEVKTMRDLIAFMAEKMLTERKELFVAGESVRPGILVLINDADWEIEGQLGYELQDKDEIAFISTLHGG